MSHRAAFITLYGLTLKDKGVFLLVPVLIGDNHVFVSWGSGVSAWAVLCV